MLEQVTAAAFGQRRKMLRQSLKSLPVDPLRLLPPPASIRPGAPRPCRYPALLPWRANWPIYETPPCDHTGASLPTGMPDRHTAARLKCRICAGHQRRNEQKKADGFHEEFMGTVDNVVEISRLREHVPGLPPVTGRGSACWADGKSARCCNRNRMSRTDNSVSWTDDLIACAMCSGLKRAASCSAVRLNHARSQAMLVTENLLGRLLQIPDDRRARTRPPKHNRSHQSPTSGSPAGRCSGRRDDCCANPHPS